MTFVDLEVRPPSPEDSRSASKLKIVLTIKLSERCILSRPNTKMRYLIIFFCYIKSERTDLKPEIPSQIHLSYHDAQTRSISWVTFENSPVSFTFLSSGFALNRT